jgi:glycine dehydrogenase subunit 1
MPFIPHTEQDVKKMLTAVGVSSIEDLFDEIPGELRSGTMEGVPAGIGEYEVGRLMRRFASTDGTPLCFAGGGAYEHHIPAAIWEITTRGEYYSAYTPYQAEASQGTLQLIYEYQTMMAKLTGLAVSNASLYDGASGLAEAVLMAFRANRRNKSQRVLVPGTVHPVYRKVLHTILPLQDIEIVELPVKDGRTDPEAIRAYAEGEVNTVIIPQPNYFGVLEDVDALTDAARALGALSIAVVNPISLALLTPPGEWGAEGVDIACGEGQPLGVPMSSGGPYFGFLTCRQQHVRQMPGRLVGRTVDVEGREGFTLTLQAREQHIRRAKAKSNICTNQGLMVTAATMYLTLLGPEGLRRVALASHNNTRALVERLTAIDGVERIHDHPYFHECALGLPCPGDRAVEALAKEGILAGVALGRDYEGMDNGLLVCATETKDEADIERFANALQQFLKEV